MIKPRPSSHKYILILDASTIVVLQELGYTGLVDELRATGVVRIIVPKGVEEEFLNAGSQTGISSDNYLDNLKSGGTFDDMLDLPRSLGKGELSAILTAISLSLEFGVERVFVITDDRRARSLCQELGLNVMGTLGLIEFAKKLGSITKIKALKLIEAIPNTSLYIDPNILSKVREKILSQKPG